MANEFVDLTQMEIDLDAPKVRLASDDHYVPERPVPMPGRYFSPTRNIKVKPHKDYLTQTTDPNNWDFQIDFGRDGLLAGPGGKVVFGAPWAFIDTTPRKEFRGEGSGSGVKAYLVECGFDGVNEMGLAELQAAMLESQNRPVYVRLGFQDDRKERPEGAKRVYTSSFRTGTNEDGTAKYSLRTTLPDGRVITAVSVVEGFINPGKVRT